MLVFFPVLVSLLSSVEPPPGSIDETTFLSRALEDGPDLISAAEGVSLAEADLVRTRALDAPEVAWSTERPSDEIRQDTFVLSWTPPLAQGRGDTIRAAELAMEAARHRRELASLDRRQFLRAVFAEWALGERRASLERRHLARLEEALRKLRARVEQGEAAGLAARRLDLEVEQTRRERIRAEAQAETVRRLVSTWCPDECLGLVPELPALPPPPSTESAPPAVRAARAELTAAEARVEAARAVLAAPRLEAGWQRQEDAEASRAGPVASVGWPLPLWGTRKADRATARAALESAQARLRWTESSVARERHGALATYIALRERVLASGGLVDAAAGVADASFDAFRLGGVPLTDLLDAWRSAREVEIESLELHGEAAAAHRRLERLGGM